MVRQNIMVQEQVEEEAVHRAESEEETCGQVKPSQTYPSDLLPPEKPHFLKFPQSHKHIPAGTKHSAHEPVGDTSYSNHNRA
jgi:hypothetical protein